MPPGSRTSGRLVGVEPGDQRRRRGSSSRSGSRHVKGRRLLRANSTIRIVASDERGPTISRPTPSHLLQRLAPRDEGRQQEVAQRPVLEQQRPQRVAIDRDVAQRLRDDRRQEDGLPGEEVHLAEEARRAVADDLVAGRIEDRHLAFEDRDERVAPVADPEQHVADGGGALLAELGERLELRRGERRAGGRFHRVRISTRSPAARSPDQAAARVTWRVIGARLPASVMRRAWCPAWRAAGGSASL